MEDTGKNIIRIGLFDRYFEPSAEWLELLDIARENERVIRCMYPSAEEQEEAACNLIPGDTWIFQAALLALKDVRKFCEFCLMLRGPFKGARQRKLAREQSRLLRYLAEGAPIPDSPESVLKLWETANRLEPRWADDLPAHFRTPLEDIPFSHEFFRRTPGRCRMDISHPPRKRSARMYSVYWTNFTEMTCLMRYPLSFHIINSCGSIHFPTATDILHACFAADCFSGIILP